MTLPIWTVQEEYEWYCRKCGWDEFGVVHMSAYEQAQAFYRGAPIGGVEDLLLVKCSRCKAGENYRPMDAEDA